MCQDWKNYIRSLHANEIELIAITAVERLIEIEEVFFAKADPGQPEFDEPPQDAALVWESTGEDIRELKP